MSSSGSLTAGVNVGVTFKADDGTFLCPDQHEGDGFSYIGYVKNKNDFCEFFVKNLGDRKVRLRDSRGFYLRRTERGGRHPIEALQMEPDKSCEFQLFTANGKLILKADNGLFVTRYLSGLYSGVNTVEAAAPNINVYCELIPEVFVKKYVELYAAAK